MRAGYIFVQTDPGRAGEVADLLVPLPWVRGVELVHGPYDLVVVFAKGFLERRIRVELASIEHVFRAHFCPVAA